MKYITCEGGIFLIETLMECGLINQLNFTLMRTGMDACIDENMLACIDMKWKPMIGFDYMNHNCCFVIFDPSRLSH